MKPTSFQDRVQLGLRVRVLQVLRGADQRVLVPKMSLELRCLASEVFFFNPLANVPRPPVSCKCLNSYAPGKERV